jgi:hypothetical protein
MSTEYELGHGLVAVESGSRISIGVDRFSYDEGSCIEWLTDSLDEEKLRALIIELIHACSYIADDPEVLLKRFNTTYEDKI